jgi:2,4-dienoyl-CoA reductase (NADPH2)
MPEPPVYPHLLAPITIGGLRLRNRVLMGSMHTGLEEAAGGHARLAAFYAERARGGVGLIVTGGLSPNDQGVHWDGMRSFDSEQEAQRHRVIPAAVHAEGGAIVLQLLHCGRYAHHARGVAPSALRSPVSPATPRAMTEDDIEQTLGDYARAARLACLAGYDGVELMASEGYLIHQFLTLRANRREDRWGGDAAGRMRFAVECIARVRAAMGPGPLLVFRLSVLDLVEDGSTWEEIAALARAAEAAGASLINAGIGWHESRVPTIAALVPRAAFATVARRLRGVVALPLATSNRINDPAVAEALLARGDADLVSMARPLLADAAFVTKAAQGRADEINTCIACNQACIDESFQGRLTSCMVNPRACRETEWPSQAARRSRRVAVVGAGPAGLASAVTAAEQGHRVTLYEASDRIGGQFRLAQRIPGKEEFAQTLRYFERRLQRLGVELRLGRSASAPELARAHDHVVLATGVRPRPHGWGAAPSGRVLGYVEAIEQPQRVGRRVAIVGAGGIGFDVAELLTDPAHGADPGQGAGSEASGDVVRSRFLATWGIELDGQTRGGLVAPRPETPPREVWLLQRKPEPPGRGLGKTTGWIRRAVLARRGVRLLSGVSYEGVDEAGLHLMVQGVRRCLEVDTVVFCGGQEPVSDLEGPLRALGCPVTTVGGARAATELDAVRAIREGTEAALELA